MNFEQGEVGVSELREYLEQMQKLHVDRSGGHARPHKALLLLAVSVLIEAEELLENRIEYNSRLLDIFRSLYEVARQGNDKNTPYNPFFYMKGEPFWRLHPLGEHTIPRQIGGPGELRELVEYASIDPALFEYLRQTQARRDIQAALIQTYCNHNADAVWTAMRDELSIERHKQRLLKEAPGDYEAESTRVRSTAFRRMVREIYDVRCAACGVRFFFDDVDLIDAAHLIPFSISKDDRPQNGMALCKNHHWLMDHQILAPGPGRGRDYANSIWYVRKGLDDRFEEHQAVISLKGRSVILPVDRALAPSRDGIEWRREQMRQAEG